MDFPGGSDGKASAYNAGDPGSIPGLGRSPGEGNSSILAWKIPWTEKPGSLQSMGSTRLSDFTFTFNVHGIIHSSKKVKATQGTISG